ncbi:hypothetical protein Sjap_021160 [Stephania japonica]|uniref:Uncharacterized protein n=1 Tax=Stephania japonica TaxID=461633 RepID=A0AAP0I0V8_9MAGN
MGNCSLKAIVEESIADPIRVMTDSGRVMEFDGPIHVRNVVEGFPGQGVFRKGQLTSPLLLHEQLFNGQLYYLLPLKNNSSVNNSSSVDEDGESVVESKIESGRASNAGGDLVSEPALEVLQSGRKGVWRVKLVIDTKQLEGILAEEGNTEALIEKMRSTVASSASTTAKAMTAMPRRTKGSWIMSWRPSLNGVFKVSPGLGECK